MLLIWLHGVLVAQRSPAKELYQGLIAIGNVKMAGEIKFFIPYTLFFWKIKRFNPSHNDLKVVTSSILNSFIRLVDLIGVSGNLYMILPYLFQQKN